MARIRTIKPDAFISESLSGIPRGTRWTFAGLWTYADDKGRARDDARLVKAALYPLDDSTTLDDVVDDLAILAEIGAICRYEVAGRRYLHMPKWGHQKINRPTPAKSPPCPLHEDGGSGHVIPPDDSLSPHGGLGEGSTWEKEVERERETEGEGEQGGSNGSAADATPPESFDRMDVENVCDYLADAIAENGSKRPTITKAWRDEARRMLDLDGRTEDEVIRAIDWCQRGESDRARFWRPNVMSMPKLRVKFDQMRLQAAEETRAKPSNFDNHLALVRQLAAEENTIPQIGERR